MLDINVRDINEHCLKVKAETPDGGFLAYLEIGIPVSSATPSLAIRSIKNIFEPAITVHVDFNCGIQIKRTYQALLDPIAPSVANNSRNKPIRWANDSDDNSAFDTVPIAATASKDLPPLPDRRKQLQELNNPNPKKQADQTVPRDTLKVSLGEEPISVDLQLTDQLKLGGNTEPASDALLLERREFFALARGENLLQNVMLEMDGLNRNLRNAEGKLSSLAEQNATKTAAFENLNQNSYSVYLVAALASMLIFSLGAVGWLVVRRRSNKGEASAWYATSKDAVEKHAALAKARLQVGETSLAGWQEPHFDPSSDAPLVTEETSSVALPSATEWLDTEPDVTGQQGAGPLDPNKSFNVEEVSDVVQQAEFWTLMNQPDRSIEILEAHASNYPDSPIAWLYLIDLYRVVEDREKYDLLGKQFKKRFNARVPLWEEDPSDTANASLTDFPMLMVRIYAVWEEDEKCIAFLQSLLIDDRDGSRVGFDLPVYREIMMLIGLVMERNRMETA